MVGPRTRTVAHRKDVPNTTYDSYAAGECSDVWRDDAATTDNRWLVTDMVGRRGTS